MRKKLLNWFLATMCAAAIPATLNAQSSPTFYGVTLYQDIYMLVSFGAGENVDFDYVFYDDDLYATGGLFYGEGKIYSNWLEYNPYGSIDYVHQYIFDAKSGDRLDTRRLPSEAAGFAINYDETQDCVYGYFIDPVMSTEGGFYAFCRQNLHDGWPTQLGATVSVHEPVVAIAFNPDGECYGIDYQGRLVSINKASGRATVIGETGMTPDDVPQSVCFDPVTGKFYWAAVSTEGNTGVYEIDLQTAQATLVASYEVEDGEGIQGLYIPYPDPTEDSPKEVEQMALNFETTSLTGTVTFTAPTTTIGGQAITGPFKAYVFLDTETKEIDVMPGQEYTVEMSVSTNQMYNCRVWTMIGDNRSAKHTVTKWIGADYPKAPTNLQVFEENGKVVFTWDTPPATGVHDGYVNPDEITYIIARGTDFHITGYEGNRFEEEASDETQSYQYYIRSSYNGLNGEDAYSDVFVMGSSLTVPLDFGFSENYNLLTIIDANNDGNTWTASFGSVNYNKNNNTANDWLITPKVVLNANTQYHMTLTAEAQKFFNDELIEVFMGEGATVENMTNKLGNITVSKINGNSYELVFTCQQSGEYNFGFHCVSTSGSTLKLINLAIEAVSTVGIDQVSSDEAIDNTYYDLMGRKIANPQHGNLYIRNNKVILY